jgi:hypothetical protein
MLPVWVMEWVSNTLFRWISLILLDDRPAKRLTNENELIQRENAQPDAINELAIQVLNRVQRKLTGTTDS